MHATKPSVGGLDSSKEDSWFRSAVDRLLAEIAGRADRQLLRQLKQILSNFEQHNLKRLAELNAKLLKQHELQLQLTVVLQLTEALNHKFLLAMKEGIARASCLADMYSGLQDITDAINRLPTHLEVQRGSLSANERLRIERFRLEMACRNSVERPNNSYGRCTNQQCQLKTKQILRKNGELIQQICSLEQSIACKNDSLLQCSNYIARLKTELNKLGLLELEVAENDDRASDQLSLRVPPNSENNQEPAIQQTVSRGDQPVARPRLFTLSGGQSNSQRREHDNQQIQQTVYHIQDGQLLRLLVVQALTLEQLIPINFG